MIQKHQLHRNELKKLFIMNVLPCSFIKPTSSQQLNYYFTKLKAHKLWAGNSTAYTLPSN